MTRPSHSSSSFARAFARARRLALALCATGALVSSAAEAAMPRFIDVQFRQHEGMRMNAGRGAAMREQRMQQMGAQRAQRAAQREQAREQLQPQRPQELRESQPAIAPRPIEQPGPPDGRPGRLTPEERRALRQQINDVGREIYRPRPRP